MNFITSIRLRLQARREYRRYIRQEPNHVWAIIKLVQENQDFFDAHIGQSCLQAAYWKLAKLIEEDSEKDRYKVSQHLLEQAWNRANPS